MLSHRPQEQGLALTCPSNKASATGASFLHCHQKPRYACPSPAGVQRDRAKIKGVTEVIFLSMPGEHSLATGSSCMTQCKPEK